MANAEAYARRAATDAATAGTADTLKASENAAYNLLGELEGTIKAIGNPPETTAAQGKLDAADRFFKQAQDAYTDEQDLAKAKVFFDKAAQFAQEGLQLLGKDPSASDTGSGSSSSSGSGGSAPVTRTITGPGLVVGQSGISGISELVSAQDLAAGIINFFLSFVSILAVAILIYGGFLYITAAGDPGKADKGKTIIMQSVIGILIIIGSWTIVNTVINLQGGGSGSGGGGSSQAIIARSITVTISGTTLLGANVQGSATVVQRQAVDVQLSSSTAGGFIRNSDTIRVYMDGAVISVGVDDANQGGVSLPVRDVQQAPLSSTGPLKKGKIDIMITQR